jgi:hypothetical protein
MGVATLLPSVGLLEACHWANSISREWSKESANGADKDLPSLSLPASLAHIVLFVFYSICARIPL